MRVIFLLSMFFLVANSLLAQQKHSVKLLAKSNGKVIILRWSPTDAQLWLYGNKQGYVLERYTMTRGKELLKSPERKIISTPVFKPKPLAQWEANADKNDYSAIAAQAIFGSSFDVKAAAKQSSVVDVINKVKEQEQRFSFAVLAADLSFKTATLSGLAFKDSTIKPDEKYLYRLFVSSQEQMKSDTALFFISLADTTSAVPVHGLRGHFENKTVKLEWPREIIEREYSGFIIERSAGDTKNFSALNKIPFIGFSDAPRSNFQFVDSLPAYETQYHYRIRGVTPFGELGPPSESVSGKSFKPLNARAAINEAKEESMKVLLKWKVTGETSLIKGFFIERSADEAGEYLTLNKEPVQPNERSFTDGLPESTNYYRIKTVGQHGEATLSMPYLIQLADSIPPLPPMGLEAKIDTLGIVSLSWKGNTEKDLNGYRVFRSNFKNAEYSQLSNAPVKSTVFKDTISLKSLTGKIYYKINAEDKRHNPSGFSEVIEIIKPDRIPPVAPVFKIVKSVLGAVNLEWTKSASDDVELYIVQRKSKTEANWSEIKKILANDSLIYRDTQLDGSKDFYYSIIAVDKAGNRSGSSNPILAKAIPEVYKKPMENISYEIDRGEKKIRLKWDYANGNVTKYVIYRSVQDDPLSLYKSISGKNKIFEDTELSMNTSYTYRIKAVFDNGSESGFSDKIVLNY